MPYTIQAYSHINHPKGRYSITIISQMRILSHRVIAHQTITKIVIDKVCFTNRKTHRPSYIVSTSIGNKIQANSTLITLFLLLLFLKLRKFLYLMLGMRHQSPQQHNCTRVKFQGEQAVQSHSPAPRGALLVLHSNIIILQYQMFEQELSHFHFTWGPTNYVICHQDQNDYTNGILFLFP